LQSERRNTAHDLGNTCFDLRTNHLVCQPHPKQKLYHFANRNFLYLAVHGSPFTLLRQRRIDIATKSANTPEAPTPADKAATQEEIDISMNAHETPAPRDFTARRVLGLTALLLVAFWVAEWLLGRKCLSDSGFGIWTGAWTHHTSQWIPDPYTFTHLLHGIFFYWLLLPSRRWLSIGSRFLIASLMEASWEILENAPLIIDRYRTATAALDYYGDSILNSTFDLFAAMAGFWLAWRYNWKWMMTLIVAIELLCLYFVRDNLTLNILMLICPSEAIKKWQLGIS
jgi:hypothetical protein